MILKTSEGKKAGIFIVNGFAKFGNISEDGTFTSCSVTDDKGGGEGYTHIKHDGLAEVFIAPETDIPLESLRQNPNAVSQKEFDAKIKDLESRPAGGSEGG
ncbi:hypothetical protein [Candidatus Liberibacter sp.]|uniref:hypothetical protein n=1 Tax=Candidatus Liberibacter sp. TaxID=34022 RepID=UPI0015F7506B|nr:hypothetical protein [Candidatus Liberibacter sp.]MBA5723667.1 hypothetical protein [Candidatus Liberibacter sp.]